VENYTCKTHKLCELNSVAFCIIHWTWYLFTAEACWHFWRG